LKLSFPQHYYKEAVKILAQAVHVGGKEGGKVRSMCVTKG